MLYYAVLQVNSSTVVSQLEKKVEHLSETQRFVGDSILDIIGDLERTVITVTGGADGHGDNERLRDGNTSIIKLKELVRVLCGELSIAQYSDNCSQDPVREDIPRRRTSSAIAPDTSAYASAALPRKPVQGEAEAAASVDADTDTDTAAGNADNADNDTTIDTIDVIDTIGGSGDTAETDTGVTISND
jgi:hypothetical protein